MTYGINLYGFRNSISISSEFKNMVFRGKATRVTGTGLTYYPADDPGIRSTYQFPAPPSISYSSTGIAGRYENRAFRSSCGTEQFAFSNLVKDNGFFTYSIESPLVPHVFFNTSNPDTRGTVLSVNDTGAVGPNGFPIWYIKVLVTFLAGTAEATFLPHLTLYCFSDMVPSETDSTYGVSVFKSDGSPSFLSNKKPLLIKDYVTITGSNNPPNLAGLIYTRSFSDNPVQSVFSISKPGFMNIDFARYETFGYLGWVLSGNYRIDSFVPRNSDCSGLWAVYRWLKTKYITGGVSKNIYNSDIVFSIVAHEHNLGLSYFDFYLRYDPGTRLPNQDIVKYENFPVTIPIIDCEFYD